MTKLNRKDILNRIPHRGENLLLDECTILENNSCNFELTIDSSDILGREIFAAKYNGLVIPAPVLTEISALASIVSSGTIEPGTFAYFAAITNFSTNNVPFKLKQKMIGDAAQTSSKNGFYKYSFNLSSGNANATGQLMAYYAKDMTDSTPDPIEISAEVKESIAGQTLAFNSLPHKPRLMTFVDKKHELVTSNETLYSYQYPLSHPLIQGHFPGNPVMMGVCQWQMLEDALSHFFSLKDIAPAKVSCSASIFKKDFTPVCDIKNAVVTINKSESGTYASTESVKKIMFKQRVQPADLLYIHIIFN